MRRFVVAALALVALALPAAAVACEVAGPNTHVGTVVAVDAAKHTLTLRDAQTSKDLTFVASPEVLRGVAVRDQVAVVYAENGGRLTATAIRKSS
jgi:hypothetical protein